MKKVKYFVCRNVVFDRKLILLMLKLRQISVN